MSICIISDHITKTIFHYNPQHIDQVKPKYEEVGGFSPQIPPPLYPPLDIHNCRQGNEAMQS